MLSLNMGRHLVVQLFIPDYVKVRYIFLVIYLKATCVTGQNNHSTVIIRAIANLTRHCLPTL